MAKEHTSKKAKPSEKLTRPSPDPDAEFGAPDWNGRCEVCGESPIVPETGMCGPCTFGSADTIGGNW
jgi:hypothetical protein